MKLDVDIISKLVPNPITLIVQLCSTLVLYLLVRKFLWKPVMKFFAAREEKMQEDFKASEDAKKAAFEDRETALTQLKEASTKADQMIEAAQKEANIEKETILLNANKEAAMQRQKAHEQIEAERQNMYEDMKKEMVNIAMAAAGQLISNKSSEEMDRDAVDAFVKEATDHAE